MTEAPAIGYGAICPDDENYDKNCDGYEKKWYFGDYMTKFSIEIM